MTEDPHGFDMVLSASAREDFRSLSPNDQEHWYSLRTALLNDPTAENPRVQRLQGSGDRLLLATGREVSAFFVFLNPLVIRVIHITPISFEAD